MNYFLEVVMTKHFDHNDFEKLTLATITPVPVFLLIFGNFDYFDELL